MSKKKSGFTLVEILIVVIILGILAAVVIPQFSDASDDTRSSSVMTNLKTVRSQLQLYKAQHNETWPVDAELGQMITFTDAGGNTNASQTATFRFGPYLLRVPANPYTGVSTVTTVADPATAYTPGTMTDGWWYNSATGEFRCHVPDTVLTPDDTQVNAM